MVKSLLHYKHRKPKVILRVTKMKQGDKNKLNVSNVLIYYRDKGRGHDRRLFIPQNKIFKSCCSNISVNTSVKNTTDP